MTNYVNLIKAIDITTGDSSFIGFSKNFAEALYLVKKLTEKTQQAKNKYVFTLTYLPINDSVDNIEYEIYVIYFGMGGYYQPIQGYKTLEEGQIGKIKHRFDMRIKGPEPLPELDPDWLKNDFIAKCDWNDLSNI